MSIGMGVEEHMSKSSNDLHSIGKKKGKLQSLEDSIKHKYKTSLREKCASLVSTLVLELAFN